MTTVHANVVQAPDPADVLASLAWIVGFCNEHPEWTEENFRPDTAEGEWLEAAQKMVADSG